MIKGLRICLIVIMACLFHANVIAGQIETNMRLEGVNLFSSSALNVKYDKFTSLPFLSTSPIQLVSSNGLIEFGYDESKDVFQSDNITSVVTFNYFTKNPALSSSTLINETLTINYTKTGEYKAQNYLQLPNVTYIQLSNISIVSYKNYGETNQTIVANPTNLYLEANINADEAILFDYATSLPLSSKIGYNIISASGLATELEAYWDYIPGAEEYELEYIYIDNYDATSLTSSKANSLLDYNFNHDATRITTTNQFYKIPLVFEKGIVLFRVRGVGRSLSNNFVRLEGTWSNAGSEFGSVNDFAVTFPSQYYLITTAHEADNINWSSVRTFAESGKSGIGVSYEDGVLHNRQSLAKLNTEDKIIAQSSLYDWHGRPAISVLPSPIKQNYFGYKQHLNKFSSTEQFDKNIFDNLTKTAGSACAADGMHMDKNNSIGAANYYSDANTDKEGQQALAPDAGGLPYVQVDYYPDQTGRIKRQSLPGNTHFLGSGKEHKFFYEQPTQEELVRLFGTEVGTADNYQKTVEVDPNGQTSVSYSDDEGRTIATALAKGNPDNLIALDDAVDPLIGKNFVTTLLNNNNDPLNFTYGVANTFYAAQNEIQTIQYNVTAPTYADACVPNLCLDCIYELEISLKDDCQNELLDGDASTDGKQPIKQLLGRYNPATIPASSTNCIQNNSTLNFSLGVPTPISITIPKSGTYHLVKTLKLSTLPIEEYAIKYVEQNTCIQTLASFQQTQLNNMDITGCESLDCASCSTSVMSINASLPLENRMTQAQIDVLIAKCNLKCDVQNPCTAKEKLMLMQFKPNGYFGHQLGAAQWGVSMFNPANTLHSSLHILPSSSAIYTYASPPGTYLSSQTVFDPATQAQVFPNQLSQTNFIASHTDMYSAPWLQWHPEYCKLKFSCDPLVNAIDAYSKQIEDIYSFDEACRKGLLTPFQSMFSLQHAPLASTCPNCTGVTNHYDPLDPSVANISTDLTTGNKTTAYNAIIASINNTSYSNSTGQSVSGNIYQYAMAIANNVDPSTISSSTKFGEDACTRDKEWLAFKQIYLAYKRPVMDLLKTEFMDVWNNNPNRGGCLSEPDLAALPAYIKIFPQNISASSASTAMNDLLANSNNGNNAINTAQTQITQQCTNFCNSYVDNWVQNLSPCFDINHTQASVWNNLKNHLLSICTGGCDAQDPFGASNTSSAINITVNGQTYSVLTFNDVLNAYKAQNLIVQSVNCSAFAISTPKPKGSSLSGAAATTPTLDACGCNTILDIHTAYLALGNTCTLSEAEFAKQNYNVILPGFGNYACACQSAVTSATGVMPRTFDFTTLTPLQKGTLFLPETMACKNCKNCEIIGRIQSDLVHAFGSGATLSSIPQNQLLSWLNITYKMNNTYDEWMSFIENCKNVAEGGTGYIGVSQKGFEFVTLLNTLATNEFLHPNMSNVNPYYLNHTNASSFFNSSIWLDQTLNAGVTNPIVEVRSDPTVYNNQYTTVYLYSNNTTPAFDLKINFPVNNGGAGVGVIQEAFTNDEWSINYHDIRTSCLTSIYSCNIGYTAEQQTPTGLNGNYTGQGITIFGNSKFSIPNSVVNYQANINVDLCTPYLCSHSIDSEPLPPNPCVQNLVNNALNTAQTQYNTYISQQVQQFIANYKNQCFANVTESTNRGYKLNEYHYTLYYYDRAGNLVHTVPPEGVDVITNPTDITNAVNYVNGVMGATPFFPKHSLNPSNPTLPTTAIDVNKDGINRYVTNYEYNTLNAPISEVTPDGGQTIYFYDYVGRLVASQNAQQAIEGSYAYTIYDDLGRITEVGKLYLSTAMGDGFTETILKNPVLLKDFLAGSYHSRKEVTKTYYDLPLNATANTLFVNGQQNTRNRVTTTTYEKIHDDDNSTYEYATFYSYDDHGNVAQIVHDNTALNYAGNTNQYKYIDYEYELISGNVKKVSYQKNKPDAYYHKYEYDADNRLHEVYTSNNDVIYTRDAKYFYYQHGPLARTELGEKQVQGTDYAYTIQGWVKGVNSNILSETTDIGKDGNTTNAFYGFNQGTHQKFAKDAASFSLNYFNGDFNAIKTSSQNFLADVTNLSNAGSVGFNKNQDAPDLYNGNISSMVTSIYDIRPLNNDQGTVKPQFTAYRYDQLQRIRQMKAYSTLNQVADAENGPANQAIDLANNQWNTPTAQNYVGVYEMTVDYDRNGNIQHLTRKGDAAYNTGTSSFTARQMDNLTYKYQKAGTAYALNRTIKVTNQLLQVQDAVTSTYNDDIDNQINLNNYEYNGIGSLTKDISEQIETIEWTAAKKVKSVQRTAGSTKPDLYFEYNAFGQRIAKKVVKRPGGVPDEANAEITHYVLDATGNQLAVYKEKLSSVTATTLKCNNHFLFGSGRLGADNTETDMLATPVVTTKLNAMFGRKEYECTNHLGNVITTLSDRKLQVQGSNIGLLNDYETPFAQQSNTQVFAGNASCNLSSQAFSPNLQTEVQRGDEVTASIKTYYLNATTTGGLVISYADELGQPLKDINGNMYWYLTSIAPPLNSWQTLTNTQNVPNTVYSSAGIVYYGKIRVNSHVWNTTSTANPQPLFIDNHSLQVTPANAIVDYYKPDITTTTDYYAFGQSMPGRSHSLGGVKYKRGYIGKESDRDEGFDNYDFGNRLYNEKIGKFLSVDPYASKYPFFSPYHYAGNSPIYLKDNDGNEIIIHYMEGGKRKDFTYFPTSIQKGNITNDVAKKTIEYLDKLHSISEKMSEPELDAYKGVNVSPHEMLESLMEKGYELHLYVYDEENTNDFQDNIYKHIGSNDFGTPSLMEEVINEEKSNIYYSPNIAVDEYNTDRKTKAGGAPTAVSILAHELKHSYDDKINQLQKLKDKKVPNYKDLSEKSAMMMENIVTLKNRCDYNSPLKRNYFKTPRFTHKYKIQSNGQHKYNTGNKKRGDKFKKTANKAINGVKKILKKLRQFIGKAFKRGRYNLKTKK